jgi:hypothetical protein
MRPTPIYRVQNSGRDPRKSHTSTHPEPTVARHRFFSKRICVKSNWLKFTNYLNKMFRQTVTVFRQASCSLAKNSSSGFLSDLRSIVELTFNESNRTLNSKLTPLIELHTSHTHIRRFYGNFPAGGNLGGIHATVWYLTIYLFQLRGKRPTRVILENYGCKFTHSWETVVKNDQCVSSDVLKLYFTLYCHILQWKEDAMEAEWCFHTDSFMNAIK